jgi:hypothetical protein
MRSYPLVFLLAVLASFRPSDVRAESVQAGSIAFILDCSSDMNEEAEAKPETVRQVSNTEAPTRLEAADGLLREMFRELAGQPNCRVAVWLYGHRLVWEQEVKHPDLLSQDDYLEATVGFGALNGLLPGDDVEQVQSFRPFTLQEAQQLNVRFDTLKPWGEKPLYLALTRAMEALVDQPVDQPKTIIVLTSGRNEQWLARYKTSRERVAGALRNNLTPIHFLHFGPTAEEDDPAESELRELAAQGGGSLVHVHTGTELTVAEILSSSRRVQAETVTTGDEADEDGTEAAEAPPARPVNRTISGSVVYYGKPVSSATVTLEGTHIPPTKTDRQGRFLIRDVPSGRKYHIVVKAVARNHAREADLDLHVAPEGEEQPFLKIDVK